MQRLKKNPLGFLIYGVIFLVSIWICWILVYGKSGIVSRRNLQQRISALQEEVVHLEREIDLADLELKNLKDNTYIEGYARELGYKKKGEVIYKFMKRKN